MPPRRHTTPSVNGDEGKAPKGRNVQAVTDVGDPEQLIRYAVAAQLARLEVSDRTVATAIKGGASALAHALGGTAILATDALRQLDEMIVALAPQLGHTGGLAQFGVRMRGLHDRSSLTAILPPTWTRDLLTTEPADELHVLIQASALLTHFMAADKAKRGSSTIRDKFAAPIREVADRLILIAGGPPTAWNIEAQIQLGNLARYAFDLTIAQLEDSLRYSPLGFRVWRALTKMVLIAKDDEQHNNPFLANHLRPRLADLLGKAQQLRLTSAYPGRSLDLELAISLPHNWLRPDTSITEVLLTRAHDTDATLRERGTAAMGLWQRAVQLGRTEDPEARQALHALLDHFGDAEQVRPDIASGLRWVATTLRVAMETGVPVCNEWPELDEPWYHAVIDAARSLEHENIPDHVRTATRSLFLHTILQNAGVERRKAIDTLIAGGWTAPVARALGKVLDDERTDGWVRIRALFALGFLQHRDAGVVRTLTSACRLAHGKLTEQADPPRVYATELHTALFAVGDNFGVRGTEQEAQTIRDNLRPILTDLVHRKQTHDAQRYPVGRALAYLLTFTAEPRRAGQPDLAEELLGQLADHPDNVTKRFAEWALSFRFGSDGEIRPLLRAPVR